MTFDGSERVLVYRMHDEMESKRKAGITPTSLDSLYRQNNGR